METSNIKSYAPKARVAFMDEVAKRLNTFGISANKKGELQVVDALVQGSVLQIGDNNFDSKLAPARQRLVERSEQLGYAQLVEQVAYTWFNRLCAIRYMEIHGYLGHGFRVLSHPNGDKRFEILDHAQDAAEDLGLDRDRIIDLMLAGDKNEELYRELLLGQCHKLHEAMPFLFESLNDETELLLPDNLTRTDSILRGLVDSIPEEDWQQVEVIGWLYQFYISEKKDQVIGKVVKTEDIPAATQLFTPNWIVKYMVQNSLGAQWFATYPDSPLKAQMEYYIEPAEQTDEVNAQLKAITPESLNPEELTLIDPASGSGHILVEAYDLFKAIYLERGYRQRDIAQLILEKNLFGLDIDQRAAQLTGFALMMKGREDDRRLFERGIKLNIMAMHNSSGLDPNTLAQGINLASYQLNADDLTEFIELFEHAHDFGSLIQIPPHLADKLPAFNKLVQNETHNPDLFVSEALQQLTPLVEQANILAAQYDAVVANPPYMGSKGMNTVVKKFAKDNFPNAKSDLFACFIERGYSLAKATGYNAMVTMQSWMFLSSFEAMRTNMLAEKTITSMAHLGSRAFGSISGEVVQTTACVLKNIHIDDYRPTFFRLLEGNEEQKRAALIAGNNRYDQTAQDEFTKIPGSPVAYWVDEAIRNVFLDAKTLGEVAYPRQGMATTNNDLFLRRWFEVDADKTKLDAKNRVEAIDSRAKWFPYNKGGSYRKWYGNNEFLVNFENDGQTICDYIDNTPGVKVGSNGRVINREHYFKPSSTWSFISSSYLGVRRSDVGFIFDVGGSSSFPPKELLNQVVGFLCSKVAFYLMRTLNPTLNFQVGNIAQLPFIGLPEINSDVDRAVDIVKEDWNFYERSWAYEGLASKWLGHKVSSYIAEFTSHKKSMVFLLTDIENNINIKIAKAYRVEKSIDPKLSSNDVTISGNLFYRYDKDGDIGELEKREVSDTVSEIISYAIGCMMGRYSLDEPGLIYANSGNEGFDASRYTKFPADDDGIIPLIDNEWFADDAANRLFEFISVAWDKAHLEENLDFLAANLSPKKGEGSRDTIRRYLCDKFYKDHLQTYKKRPIYWLFSSGKQKAFQCLVYLHRYNESTLSRMRTEYVTPLLGKYQAYAEQLDKQLEMAESTQDKKRLEKELKIMDNKQSELREFDDKLKHYADMRISIDLDDGVKENYGKFGDLLADVKNITGKKPEVINAG